MDGVWMEDEQDVDGESMSGVGGNDAEEEDEEKRKDMECGVEWKVVTGRSLKVAERTDGGMDGWMDGWRERERAPPAEAQAERERESARREEWKEEWNGRNVVSCLLPACAYVFALSECREKGKRRNRSHGERPRCPRGSNENSSHAPRRQRTRSRALLRATGCTRACPRIHSRPPPSPFRSWRPRKHPAQVVKGPHRRLGLLWRHRSFYTRACSLLSFLGPRTGALGHPR